MKTKTLPCASELYELTNKDQNKECWVDLHIKDQKEMSYHNIRCTCGHLSINHDQNGCYLCKCKRISG